MKTYVGIFIFSHVMTWCRIKNRGAPTSPRQPPKQPKTSLHRRTAMSPPPPQYHCSPMAAEAQMVESSCHICGAPPQGASLPCSCTRRSQTSLQGQQSPAIATWFVGWEPEGAAPSGADDGIRGRRSAVPPALIRCEG